MKSTIERSSSAPFNAIAVDRKESALVPGTMLVWALILAIAIFSVYVYVLTEQVNRAEIQRQALLHKKPGPASVEPLPARPASRDVIGYPDAETSARHDFIISAVSRR
jgi:hypothetical protein